MVDLSLLVLALGAAASIYVGMAKLSQDSPLALTRLRDKLSIAGECCVCINEDNCLLGIQLVNLECLDIARAEILRILLETEHVVGLAVIVARRDTSKLVKKIENMIATYDVILEAQPENKRVYMKKRILEDLLTKMSAGLKIIESSYVLLVRSSRSECRRKAEEVKHALELHECRTRLLCGRNLLTALMARHGGVVTASDVVENVVDVKNTIPAKGEVYLGRVIGTNTPVFLPTRECHTLILGPTGSGKTTLLATIASRAIALEIASGTYVVDPKGDLAAALKGLVDVIDAQEAASSLILPKQALIRVRGGNVEHDGVIVKTLANLIRRREEKLVVIDEAWRATRAFINAFIPLFKESRSFKTSLILASQDPEDVPEEIWNNICALIAFGSHDREYIAKIRRVVHVDEVTQRFLLHSDRGKAIIKTRWNRKPLHIAVDPPQIILKNLLYYSRG